MKIYLITMGQRMPNWVEDAYAEYAKRLPSNYQLILKALPIEKRLKNRNAQTLMEKESKTLWHSCPDNTYRIALDRQGASLDTHRLAMSLQTWHDCSQNIAIMVGGPEGISSEILEQADTIWSLSKLTLPHPLVRVLIAEQIYRAFSILSNHPYHR